MNQTWVAAEFRKVDIDDERVWIVVTRTGETHIVDLVEFQVLRALLVAGDMPALEVRLRNQEWDDAGLAELGDIVESMARRGLIVDSRVGFSGVKPGASWSSPGFSAQGWLTCDRPTAIARALTSWKAAVEQQGFAPPDFVVSDDSRVDPEATRRVVHEFAPTYRGRTLYLGREYRERLAKSFEPDLQPLARFALALDAPLADHFTPYGGTANTLLLSLGDRLFSITDDDMVPHFRVRKDFREGLVFHSNRDPAVLTPLANEGELADLGVPSSRSPFFPHLTYLGRPVAELLSREQTTWDARLGAGSIARAGLPGARVAALNFHYWGDSGLKEHRFLLTDRQQVDAAAYDQARYGQIRGGRLVFRAPLSDTLGGQMLFNGHLCLDGRELLPPYSPFGPNFDTLWLATLTACHPEAFLLYPREAIHHAPVDVRHGLGPGDYSTGDEMNLWLVWIFSDQLAKNGPLALSYASLGQFLKHLGSAPEAERNAYLLELGARITVGRLGELTAEKRKYRGQPRQWAQDIDAAMAVLEARLGGPEVGIAREFRPNPAAMGNYLVKYGSLLEGWPQLWAAAARHREAVLASAVVKP